MNFDSHIKKYIKRLSRTMPNNSYDKKRLLTDIEKNLRHHIRENPSASWDEVIEEFGTADEMAESLIEISPRSDILVSLQSKKQMHMFLLLLCIISIIICVGTVLYKIRWESTDHYIKHEPYYIFDGTEVSSEEFERNMNEK
ncbi:MAG: hypothetical protein HFJ05_09910 [Eubacterium sp.]|nr:hypothetical protein [Eubacterium sp.]